MKEDQAHMFNHAHHDVIERAAHSILHTIISLTVFPLNTTDRYRYNTRTPAPLSVEFDRQDRAIRRVKKQVAFRTRSPVTTIRTICDQLNDRPLTRKQSLRIHPEMQPLFAKLVSGRSQTGCSFRFGESSCCHSDGCQSECDPQNVLQSTEVQSYNHFTGSLGEHRGMAGVLNASIAHANIQLAGDESYTEWVAVYVRIWRNSRYEVQLEKRSIGQRSDAGSGGQLHAFDGY